MPMRSGGQQVVILVVDDEPVIRDLCAKGLIQYRILQATSLKEAVACYAVEPVDLVLTDVQMPGGSGIELLREIKKTDPTAVVVVMTGFTDKETVLEALQADADDFIQKPVNLLQLRTAVEKALGKRALKEELAAMHNLDSQKDAFLAQVSHKLKTPLTSLSLALEELERYASTVKPEAACQQRLASMREDLVKLSSLMASLLRVHQAMGPQKGPLTHCDLTEIVRTAAESVARVSEKWKISLEFVFETVPPIVGNRDRLTFAMQQIFENAFKFSGDTGKIITFVSAIDGTAKIMVCDNGCGIAESEMPKIFEQFYQVDPDATGQVPGFGLGLFSAREIVRQHDGTITVNSQPGQGTTGTIVLKVAEE
jgi:signal transduction histidine kinase